MEEMLLQVYALQPDMDVQTLIVSLHKWLKIILLLILVCFSFFFFSFIFNDFNSIKFIQKEFSSVVQNLSHILYIKLQIRILLQLKEERNFIIIKKTFKKKVYKKKYIKRNKSLLGWPISFIFKFFISHFEINLNFWFPSLFNNRSILFRDDEDWEFLCIFKSISTCGNIIKESYRRDFF